MKKYKIYFSEKAAKQHAATFINNKIDTKKKLVNFCQIFNLGLDISQMKSTGSIYVFFPFEAGKMIAYMNICDKKIKLNG